MSSTSPVASPQSTSEPSPDPPIPSADIQEGSASHFTGVDEGSRPDVDGPVNMTAYRLEMDIESVFYFRHRTRACCAILIHTVFCLKDGMLGEICPDIGYLMLIKIDYVRACRDPSFLPAIPATRWG
jgi:hypothetical protein